MPLNIIERLRLPEARTDGSRDAAADSVMHGEVIRRKPFLKMIYRDFYRRLVDRIEYGPGDLCVELGSGGGFLKELLPQAVTSEVMAVPGVDMRFSALSLPFRDGSVRAFVMIDVLHHLPDPARFFREAARCLTHGGKVVMIEPANTAWGRFVYTRFHHERFDPSAEWGFTDGCPLYNANGALPWIIFCRDKDRFAREFPALKIACVSPHTPFRYLLSGGLSFRQLVPSWSYGFFNLIERILGPLNSLLGMFMTVELKKA